jgi:hypothetical protein
MGLPGEDGELASLGATLPELRALPQSVPHSSVVQAATQPFLPTPPTSPRCLPRAGTGRSNPRLWRINFEETSGAVRQAGAQVTFELQHLEDVANVARRGVQLSAGSGSAVAAKKDSVTSARSGGGCGCGRRRGGLSGRCAPCGW